MPWQILPAVPGSAPLICSKYKKLTSTPRGSIRVMPLQEHPGTQLRSNWFGSRESWRRSIHLGLGVTPLVPLSVVSRVCGVLLRVLNASLQTSAEHQMGSLELGKEDEQQNEQHKPSFHIITCQFQEETRTA